MIFDLNDHPMVIVEVYKSVVEEAKFFDDLFERRLAFFTGLLTAILGGLAWITVNGFSSSWLFPIGCVTLIFVSLIGTQAATKASDRINRIITERAKLEQVLGLTTPIPLPGAVDRPYWAEEPIVATQHLESRREHQTSEQMIEANMRDQNRSNYLTRAKKFYLFALTIGSIAMIYWGFNLDVLLGIVFFVVFAAWAVLAFLAID